MERRKIALLGCGRWGKLILRDLKSQGCEVIVWARSEASVANALEFNADLIVGKISEIPTVDGIVVATITRSHFEVIKNIGALQPGVPIFCEKPLCLSKNELQELSAGFSDVLFEMHKWRYHPGILELSRIVKDSEYGQLRGIKTQRIGWGVPHNDVDATWILLPHELSIIYEILGYLPEIKHVIFDKNKDNIQGLHATLGSDPWVHVEVSERSSIVRREVKLFFEDAIATLGNSYDRSIEVLHTNDRNLENIEHIPIRDDMPLFMELQVFLNYLSDRKTSPKSSFSESTIILEKLIAIRDFETSS